MPKSDSENVSAVASKSSRLQNAGEKSLPDFSISVSAPGKLILHGEHSVVYGKLGLAASLGLRTRLTLQEYRPSEITVNSVNINLHAVNLMHCYQPEDVRAILLKDPVPLLKPSAKSALDRPELVDHELLLERVERFVKTKCGSVPLTPSQNQALTSLLYLLAATVSPLDAPLEPFTLTSTTDLAVSSGLGSSASFLVTAAAAFVHYARHKARKANGASPEAARKSLGKKDLDLVSRWAFAAEKIIHGTPSGLDNTICTYGSIVEFRKGMAPVPVELGQRLRVLLVNTKIPRDTKALVARVASLRRDLPAVVDRVFDAMDEVSKAALAGLLELDVAAAADEITPEERRGRTAEIYKQLGSLSDVNQNLLRALGVSHPSLDGICSTLLEEGLHGKLTGAGGGGYAIAVVPQGFEQPILDKIIARMEGLGFEAVVTDLGGPGVTLHQP